MLTVAVIMCPSCGHRATQSMPVNACQHFYECTACSTVLRPKAGDCCVFCSYADTPCPPMQVHNRDHDENGAKHR